MTTLDVDAILAKAGGIRLDIGCGRWKQGPDWVGLDMVEAEGVDIVWDVNRHPWPLPDECCIMAICSHFVEHIPPCLFDEKRGTWFPFMEFMDELWRIMKPDGELAIATPHGYSIGYLQDPTHCNPMHEATWAYFDPLDETTKGGLYQNYRPKPWKLKSLSWAPAGNIEVVMIKRRDDRSYYEQG